MTARQADSSQPGAKPKRQRALSGQMFVLFRSGVASEVNEVRLVLLDYLCGCDLL